jgi:signal transduction histidine kinase
MPRIRVLIVDDAVVIRRMITEALGSDPEIEVVGSAANGKIALQKIPQVNPDLITMDVEMPEMDGVQTVRELRNAGVDAAIILLTGTTDPERVADAIAAGAMKYVPKSALDVPRLEQALLAGSRVTIAERTAATMQRAAERRSRQLEQLVEASVGIASVSTIEHTAERTLAAARAMFETEARVEAVVTGIEPIHQTLSSEPAPVAVVELVRADQRDAHVELQLGRSLQPDERLLATELARIAVGNVRTVALMREAQAAARDRQDIVAVVSHDLRTPLQSLSLGIDTLKLGLSNGRSPADLVSTTERMRRSVGSMARLLGDLLDVSRIHDRALRVQPRLAELDPTLNEVRDVHLPIAESKGLTLRVETSGLRLPIDPPRLAQALTNLVSNALRHTTTGGIVQRARTRGSMVRVEVEDTGPGIAPEVQQRLFERLYQDTSSSKSGALGLGLYIVRGIAEAHGGRAGVESTVGEGSCFYLELPSEAASTQGISTSAQ